MTIRIILAYDSYNADQIVTLADPDEETRLVGLGYAVTDLDGPAGSAALALVEHAAAHAAMGTVASAASVAAAATGYADDAAAEAGGVPLGGLYNVAGVVHVRVV